MHEQNAETARGASEASAKTPTLPPVQTSVGAGERRDEIIDAARTLYEEKGMSRTSIQDITEKVGVARSLFYHYFPNKDAVTSAVLDTYVADFLEAVRYWDAHRTVGEIDEALSGVVRLLRLCLFENDSFHIALASKENAGLYIDFVGRVADRVADFMVNNTVRDYNALHEVRIEHVYETFYVLFVGLAGYLRRNPQVDDEVLCDLIAQTLHMDRLDGTAARLLGCSAARRLDSPGAASPPHS